MARPERWASAQGARGSRQSASSGISPTAPALESPPARGTGEPPRHGAAPPWVPNGRDRGIDVVHARQRKDALTPQDCEPEILPAGTRREDRGALQCVY